MKPRKSDAGIPKTEVYRVERLTQITEVSKESMHSF